MSAKNFKSYDPGPSPGDNDDGFSGGSSNARSGEYIKWTAEQSWQDRDGLAVPSPQLVIAVDEILQRWQDNKPEKITAKPLPDPDDLNSAIPIKEWELGVDGKPRPPWAHYAAVYLVNPATGKLYVYSAATDGGHIAYDDLKQSVKNMRMLSSGVQVIPMVDLGEKPFQTRFGLKSRPHFAIIDWRSPGGGDALSPTPSPLQLPPSAAVPIPASEPAAEPPGEPASNVETLPPRGGRGRGKIAVAEAIARSCFPCAFALINMQGSVTRIEREGTAEQVERYLPNLMNCSLICAPLSRSRTRGAGSDFAAIINLSQPKVRGGWEITGEKAWITNGAGSPHFL